MEVSISIASLFVALCALLFTAWQTKVQRVHNRVSVKPHLFSLNTEHKQNRGTQLQVILINNGLGPAFINKFEVYNDGDIIDPIDIVPKVFNDLSENCSWFQFGNDYAMAPNEKKVLLEIIIPEASSKKISEVQEKLIKLDLVVEYSSAYEKMEAYDSRKKS